MKKNLSIIIFVFFAILNLYGQKNTFIPNSYLTGDSIISVYHNSQGKFTKVKINNTSSDNYYETQILKREYNRFFVKIISVNGNSSLITGWVDINHVGVGLRNKSHDSIPIYFLPNFKSKKNIFSIHIESVIATIIDINGKWLKVNFDNNGKKVTGWLSPNNQCYNFFTMCTGE